MYLSKLRIFGFKSFANKVEVNFPKNGLTAVVGPNGCGKSNIIDAIRWVMGEQSAKTLRSSKMEDVIFSGTTSRPPMNMAEVSLIIDNDKGLLPGGFSQIMITRQAFRNGDSHYLLNNQPCRLKDIQHLFYDTGMGAASYSLMEAKMIDSILNEKDDERRLLFEEASGISKYKKQRAETKRQLERTTLDLTRVEDNLKHTKSSVSAYERQAKRAEKWSQIHKEYKDLELSYYWDEFNEKNSELLQNSRALENAQQQLNSHQTALTEQDTLLSEKKLDIVSYENKLGEQNQIVSNTSAEAVQLKNEMEKAEERIKHLQKSIQKNENEKLGASQKLESFASERAQLRVAIQENNARFLNLESERNKQHEALVGLHEDAVDKKEASIEISNKRLELMNEISNKKHELGQVQSRLSHFNIQLDELIAGRINIFQDEQKSIHEIDGLEKQLGDLEQEITAGRIQVAQLDLEKNSLMNDLDEAAENFRKVESAYISLETQYHLLKKMVETNEGVATGVKFLLENQKSNIKGLLFDLIQVPEEFTRLVEVSIGESLQTLVAHDSLGANDLLEALKNQAKGRAFLFAPTGENHFKRPRPSQNGLQGGWLIDQVNFDESLRPLMEFLLGNFYISSNLKEAQELAKQNSREDIWFITHQGEVLHTSGILKSAIYEDDQSGLIQNKQKLEKIRVAYENAKTKYQETEIEIKKNKGKLDSLITGLESCRDDLKKNEILQMEDLGRINVNKANLDSLKSRGQQVEEKIEKTDAEIKKIQIEIQPIQTLVNELESKRKLLDKQHDEAEELVKAEEIKKSSLENQYNQLNTETMALQTQIEKDTQRLKFIDESEKDHSGFQLKMDLDEQEWSDGITENQEMLKIYTEKMHGVNERLDKESIERDKYKSLYDEKVLELETFNKSIKNLHAEHLSLSKTKHELELKIEQLSSNVRNIKERIFEVHEIDFESETIPFEPISYQKDTAKSLISELKDKLKSIGTVNVGALQDYEEEKKRLEEVQGQFDDLEQARKSLEATIRKLDKIAREQFLETFGKIQKNFQEVFSTLFEGGRAKLELEDGPDPLDAKIEINASPSGKKMRGVTLLSGGERALTAISMLFSLYLVRTSPYCIMDEVDGPLDDANIGRFVRLLRKFSHKTQFIVVTHNKKTMEASDILYGVTQEIKGISQLASVRLEEASLIAA